MTTILDEQPTEPPHKRNRTEHDIPHDGHPESSNIGSQTQYSPAKSGEDPHFFSNGASKGLDPPVEPTQTGTNEENQPTSDRPSQVSQVVKQEDQNHIENNDHPQAQFIKREEAFYNPDPKSDAALSSMSTTSPSIYSSSTAPSLETTAQILSLIGTGNANGLFPSQNSGDSLSRSQISSNNASTFPSTFSHSSSSSLSPSLFCSSGSTISQSFHHSQSVSILPPNTSLPTTLPVTSSTLGIVNSNYAQILQNPLSFSGGASNAGVPSFFDPFSSIGSNKSFWEALHNKLSQPEMIVSNSTSEIEVLENGGPNHQGAGTPAVFDMSLINPSNNLMSPLSMSTSSSMMNNTVPVGIMPKTQMITNNSPTPSNFSPSSTAMVPHGGNGLSTNGSGKAASKKKRDLSKEVQEKMDKLFEEAKNHKKRKSLYSHLTNEPAPEIITVDGEAKYRCSLCKKIYGRKDSCRKHISSELWEYPCSFCGIISATAQACMYHVMAKHLHMQVFDCPFCDKRFATHYALSNHQERTHSSS